MPKKTETTTEGTSPAAAEPPSALFTDEGVPFEWIDPETIVNRATDLYNAHRRELRVGGRSFSHVAERGSAWEYRHDR